MAKLSAQARIAANRFGLGLRPDEATRIASDPKAWLHAQADAPFRMPDVFAKQPKSGYLLPQFLEMNNAKNQEGLKTLRRAAKDALLTETALRMLHAVQTPASFHERLVHFWSNHFSVSTKSAQVVNVISGYEREAIRPHVNGRFEDMLLAVAQHPAMLMYLDNERSFSPDSKMGKNGKKGLNENLAREILELHTLGVGGGYAQTDVIALARLITGWSLDRSVGSFVFRAQAHDTQPVTLLGKTYAPADKLFKNKARGEEALRDIARHPATARFVATKLARHFVADNPPPAAIDRLAQVFHSSGGDLRAMYHALIDLPEAWQPAPAKFKSSAELIVSAARLANAWQDFPPQYFANSFRELGNAPFTADSPAGFPDTATELLGSDVMMRRINWAPYAAKQLLSERSLAPDSAAHTAFGDTLSAATYHTITSTEDREQAYAFLFASPDFQRR